MRVLALSRLDGHPPSGARGASAAKCSGSAIPGGGELFTLPAVWHHGAHTTVFVADDNGTAAYVLRGGRLYPRVGELQPRHEPRDGRRAAVRL